MRQLNQCANASLPSCENNFTGKQLQRKTTSPLDIISTHGSKIWRQSSWQIKRHLPDAQQPLEQRRISHPISHGERDDTSYGSKNQWAMRSVYKVASTRINPKHYQTDTKTIKHFLANGSKVPMIITADLWKGTQDKNWAFRTEKSGTYRQLSPL